MVEEVASRSILTPTGGFLKRGFTHSLNPALGCAFGGASCGVYCYAQHNQWITRGRTWGLYAFKRDPARLYVQDARRVRRRGGALRIFLSSSTEPYSPQEARRGTMRELLAAMLEEPPDLLVLQTHATLVTRDLDLLARLQQRARVRVSVTVETDRDALPGLPPHPASPDTRLAALAETRAAGIPCQAAVAPLLPLADPVEFARALERAADRVILDHFLLGDGSSGQRTLRTRLPALLESMGAAAWAGLEKFEEVRRIFVREIGAARVLVSEAGFNAP